MSALPSDAALLAALLHGQEQLRAEVAALRSAVEALARRPAATDETDEILLEAISYEIGSVEFSCASLIEHAQLAAADLRLALENFFGPTPSPKRLGKWLSRMHKRGRTGRYVVDHQQDDGHRGGTWSVRILRI